MAEPKWEHDLLKRLKAEHPSVYDVTMSEDAAAGEGSRHPYSQYQKVRRADGTWTSTYRYGGNAKDRKGARNAASRACGKTLLEFFTRYFGACCMKQKRYDWPVTMPAADKRAVTYQDFVFPRKMKDGSAGPVVEACNKIRNLVRSGTPVIVGLIRCSSPSIGRRGRVLVQFHVVGIVAYAADVFLYLDTEPRHWRRKSQSHGIYDNREREMIGHIVYKDRPGRRGLNESILYAPDLDAVVMWGP